MKRIFLLFASAALSGCVGTHVDEGLQALKGEPINSAFQVLGYPSSRMSMGSDTLYSWSMSGAGMDFVPQQAMSTGLVGFTPVTITTNYTQIIPSSYSASIMILSSQMGIVKGCSWSGQIGAVEGCSGPLHNFAVAKRKKSGATKTEATPSVPSKLKAPSSIDQNGTLYLR